MRLAAGVVAVVADVRITTAEVDARVQRIGAEAGSDRLPAPGSPEERRLRRWVVHAMANEAIVAVEARAAGLAGPAAGTAGDALPLLFERVTADVAVDDGEVARYYLANPDRYQRPERRRVRQLIIADPATAGRARRRLDRGDAWTEVVAASTSSPGAADDEVGWLRRGEMAGVLEAVVFAAVPGAVLGPVQTEFGWHLAEVLEIQPGGAVPLEEAAGPISADLLAAARGRRFDEWLEQRRHSLATVAPGHEHPGDPRAPDPIHRH
ncbi:MAG TPA: peptidylprolyl isomerase [Cryptosporangiaceae bacterium]|nr:peptidylprolyl isomerase [Cryptosporangiaceae bacterium]